MPRKTSFSPANMTTVRTRALRGGLAVVLAALALWGALVGPTYVGVPGWDLGGPALSGPPEKIAHVLRKLGALGVGQVQVRLRSRSAAELIDQIGAFGAEVGPLLDG